jgi:hypothetical protein
LGSNVDWLAGRTAYNIILIFNGDRRARDKPKESVTP